MNSKKGGVA